MFSPDLGWIWEKLGSTIKPEELDSVSFQSGICWEASFPWGEGVCRKCWQAALQGVRQGQGPGKRNILCSIHVIKQANATRQIHYLQIQRHAVCTPKESGSDLALLGTAEGT